jgi:hypothetical protein
MTYLPAMRNLAAAGCLPHILLEFEMVGCMLRNQRCMAYLPEVRTLAAADCPSHVQMDS